MNAQAFCSVEPGRLVMDFGRFEGSEMPTAGVRKLLVVAVCIAGFARAVAAQDAAPAAGPTTRQAAIEQEQAAKEPTLHPYVPGRVEKSLNEFEVVLASGGRGWHPFLDSAYSGGGFTLGAGYTRFVSAYNSIDVRGSYTIAGYKKVEAEFRAPRLFQRRGSLTVLGGWREATEVSFYGIGRDTSRDDHTNFDFQQPYASATFSIFPTRRLLMLGGGVELSQWSQKPGEGSTPSVETIYTPATLPGLGAKATYLHTQATVGLDWRPSPGYARRGGFYGVTVHDYADSDDEFGFRRVDYEVIQHLPILREAWVISLRGLASTAFDKNGQQTPFFMLPSVGGGSTLRGFTSRRFRDQNSLLLQAEWRIAVNRFLDTAFFYDAGKVTARSADLDFDHLKSDVGFGLRLHGPLATPLRIELARSREGLALIFAFSGAF
jgi:opacity protein-like surface antigen